ncbi:MAG TPA: transposase [Halomicronema sp.]
MGVLLGLIRTHARSLCGHKAYDLDPFYHGEKVRIVGAITLKKILKVMTLNGSMDSKYFKVFVEYFLVPNLWLGVVVMMNNNLSTHKLKTIETFIQSD